MAKLEKLGSDVWFDLQPGEDLRLRHGPALSWFGPRETMTVSNEKAVGASLKNRALKLPLVESVISVAKPARLLAKFGTKVEVWALELDDQPVYFRGSFYLGHKGDISLTARKLSFNDLVFMVEPKGTGTIYLALPKNTQSIALDGQSICVPSDTIALIKGEPEFKAQGLLNETKDIFKKGGWARNIAAEISAADEIYIFGGSVKSLFSSSSDEEVA